MAVADAGVRERRLQAHRVRPRVLAAAHAAALSHVDDEPDVAVAQRRDELAAVKP